MDDTKKSQLERQVEENLRRVYRSVAEEPVPDRFTELLKQLRGQEEGKEE